jgi:hypothetical protein
MIIQFDTKTMHVQAICGILENYQPDSEVKEICRKVEELKVTMAAFRDSILNPQLNEIIKLIDEHNKKYTPPAKL